MRAAILCDGEFPRKPYPRYLLFSADIVICTDGALKHYLEKSRKLFGEAKIPDAVVGDMDTLPQSYQKRYSDIIHKSDDQEDNDLTKALSYLLKSYPEVEEIHILGATGKRSDHCLGNMSRLLRYASDYGICGIPHDGEARTLDIVSDYETIFVIRESESISVGKGRKVSIFTEDQSLRISSKGLEYPTDNVVFDSLWKATLNRAIEDEISLSLSHPAPVLIVLD